MNDGEGGPAGLNGDAVDASGAHDDRGVDSSDENSVNGGGEATTKKKKKSGIQPFSEQKGGQARTSLAAVKATIAKHSGNDEKGLMSALLQSKWAKRLDLDRPIPKEK